MQTMYSRIQFVGSGPEPIGFACN